ncbi:hypothetical protein HYDPIDRAFT_38120 [Hydnomerulius pinastri MD-312]|nr:hypothetical protein HYDPIDRAFT_38120 [Hydnomerulius pinastri MD-312]
MSEGNKRKRSDLEDLPRITYHAEQRTFDRLLKEHSLEQTKDIVRRKLGLSSETNVKLQQIRSGKFIDLEDDDDFDAFRALAKSVPAVDVQVTVGGSSPARPNTAKPATKPAQSTPGQMEEILSSIVDAMNGSEAPLASKTPESAKRKRKVSFGETTTAGPSKTPGETTTPKPANKKRKPAAGKETGPSASATAITPPVPDGVAEPVTTPSATSPQKAAEEPPKKRRRNAKESQSAVDSEPPAKKITGKAKALAKKVDDASVLEPAAKEVKSSKSAESKASNGQKADTGTTAESEEPAKKPKRSRKKKDEGAVDASKPFVSAASKPNGVESAAGEDAGLSTQTSTGTNAAPTDNSQLVAKKSSKRKAPADLEAEGSGKKAKSAPKSKAAPKPSAGTDNPTTNTSSSLMDALDIASIVAAIHSEHCSKNNLRSAEQPKSTEQPEPVEEPEPTQLARPPRKGARRKPTLKEAVPAPTSPPAEDVPMSNPPPEQEQEEEETVAVPLETTSDNAIPTRSTPSPPTPSSTGPPCPICLQQPFHIRYHCPTVLSGPDAIQERLDELKTADTGDHKLLINELEGLLRRSRGRKSEGVPQPEVQPEPAPSSPIPAPRTPLPPPLADTAPSREPSSPPDVSLPRTPIIPSNSHLSEVTVESRDEGSSSESSDEEDDKEAPEEEFPVPHGQSTPEEQTSLAEADLEAIIRGPTPSRRGILKLLDTAVSDDDEAEGSGEGEREGELEEDEDEDKAVERSRRRWSRRGAVSSDEEDEEESRSPSPPPQLERTVSSTSSAAVDEQLLTQDDSAEEPEPLQENEAPAAVGVVEDSGEETQVEPEEPNAPGDSVGNPEKEAVTPDVSMEKESSPPTTPAPQTSELASDQPEKAQTAAVPPEVEMPPTDFEAQVPDASDGMVVDADPIEPADDLDLPSDAHPSEVDPIEVGTPATEKIHSMFSNATQSTPKPGVTRRMKTRGGVVPDDETELPVLVEDLVSESRDLVTPFPDKKKARRKPAGMSASQEPVGTRRSTRLSSVPPPSTAPAEVTANGKAKAGARGKKAVETPAKPVEHDQESSQSKAKNGRAKKAAIVTAPTPSLVRWETMQEPTPSVLTDELGSSSPPRDGENTILAPVLEKPKKVQLPSEADSAEQEPGSDKEQERLFDLTASQIPFPYSQYGTSPMTVPQIEEDSNADSEEEHPVTKKKAATKPPPRKSALAYRTLSELASQQTFFSPSLPTPGTTSGSNGKAKKKVAEDDDSDDSSSSSSDDTKESGHIPRGRRAGSVLGAKKKKSLFSIFR